MHEYDSSGISNDCNGLTTSEIAPYVHFLRARGKSTLLAIVIYINTISGISNDYNGFTTSEIALTFTIPAYKDKRSAARDGDNGVSGISNDYNGFTTSEIAPYVHFPRARGKYRRSRG